jgi:hypothetical protein
VNLPDAPDGGDAALGLALPPLLSRDFLRGYRYGCEHGFLAGYAEAEADMARRWHEHADPIARSDPQLLRRSWSLRGEPRTRQTFGQGHRDDYDPRMGGAA